MPAMFQRRHYEAIAKALDDSRPRKGAMDQWAFSVRVFANMCRDDNSRFDRARFEKACGYGDAEHED